MKMDVGNSHQSHKNHEQTTQLRTWVWIRWQVNHEWAQLFCSDVAYRLPH